MSREIKFRAWVVSVLPGETGIYYPKVLMTLGDGSVEKLWTDSYKFTSDTCQFTLMQYTGLKDKNGVEIYEGDIVQFADKWEWHRGAFAGGFLATDKDVDEVKNDHLKYPYERRTVKIPESYAWLLSSEIQRYWEVIGNIYENPELLESK